MSRLNLTLIGLALLAQGSACTLVSGLQDFSLQGSPDGDGDGDADSDTTASDIRPVDMIFVVDDSSGMGARQRVLVEAAMTLLRELIVPMADPSGAFPPAVDDLHVGVVSTDMGSGGQPLPTCTDDPYIGDDGQLHVQGQHDGCQNSYSGADCPRAQCPWLTHSTDHPDDGTRPEDPPLWEDFSCIAELGTSGCGFEQPLEAVLRALTTQAASGRPNNGFLRNDSLLVVVFVTDEDDCSPSDDHLFDPDQFDPGPFNVRCALRHDLLEPTSRYIEALRDLRPDDGSIVVAAIVGVPTDGSWSPGEPLDSLRELVRTNPTDPRELVPICDNDLGVAYPPIRIAEVVYGFGESGLIGSICNPSHVSFTGELLRAIRQRMVVE